MKITEAEKLAGSVPELAALLGCTKDNVYKWKRVADKIPQPWLDALKHRKPEWFTNL